MAIERQAVQGLQQVQSTGGPRMAATQAIQASTPTYTDYSQGSAFLDDLMNVATSFAKVGTDIMNQAVEDDKVRQYNRALRGLMPTEDATVGGARAHMLVGLQNDVLEQTMALQDAAKRFQGTQAEWEQLVVDSRNLIQERIMRQYPGLAGNKQTMKEITNAFMEQQPKIFAAREGALLERANQERMDSMRSRIHLVTDGLTGDALNAAVHQLQQEAVTMQLTKPEFEEMFANIAMERAAIGDSTLIDATKNLKDANGVSLFHRNGKLLTSEIQADRTWSAQNQVAVFQMKDDVTQRYMAGELDQTEALRYIEYQNKQTGGTAWTDEQIKSLFATKAKQAAKNAQMQDLIMRGETGSPLGIQDIDKEQRKDYAEALRGMYTKLAEDEIAKTGAQGDEAEAIRGKYETMRLSKMAQQVITDPLLKLRFDSLMQLSPEHLKNMNVEPEAMVTLMKSYESIPEASRSSVMGDEAYAFVENYNRALEMGYNKGQAIQHAQDVAKSAKLSGSVVKELTEEVDDVVSTVASGSWLTRGDNMNDLGIDLMRQEAMDIARGMKQAGHSNDTIKKRINSWLTDNYHQLSEGFFTSGVLVKGDIRALGATMGINQADVPFALKQYITNHEQELLDNTGGMSREDLYFDVDNKRGTFVIRAGSGRTPVTAAMPLTELRGYELTEQYYNEEKRKRDEQEELFDKSMQRSWGDGGYQPQTPNKWTAKDVGKLGVADFIMSRAFASGSDLPHNFEFGYEQKQDDFFKYIAQAENRNHTGLDRQAGVFTHYTDEFGDDTIGYGHKITQEERSNGYIMIGNDKVPIRKGMSELTPERAMKLLKQDVARTVPNTESWKVPFDDMRPSVQRGIMDLTFNLGKSGIQSAPKANAHFKAGRVTDGFIEMLSTASANGKRSAGLLKRRAHAFNLAHEGNLRISEIDTREDGSMYVKFSGNTEFANMTEANRSKIGEGGWFQVYPPKANALARGTKAGKIKV